MLQPRCPNSDRKTTHCQKRPQRDLPRVSVASNCSCHTNRNCCCNRDYYSRHIRCCSPCSYRNRRNTFHSHHNPIRSHRCLRPNHILHIPPAIRIQGLNPAPNPDRSPNLRQNHHTHRSLHSRGNHRTLHDQRNFRSSSRDKASDY